MYGVNRKGFVSPVPIFVSYGFFCGKSQLERAALCPPSEGATYLKHRTVGLDQQRTAAEHLYVTNLQAIPPPPPFSSTHPTIPFICLLICYVVYFLSICNGEQFGFMHEFNCPCFCLIVCLWKINVIIIIIIVRP